MSDESLQPQPDLEQAPGWVVRDPDGNVVDSGPVIIAQPAAVDGSDTEGEQY